jgi:tyrosyl-tRNA synthetase
MTYFEHCTPLYFDEIEIFKKRLEDWENPRNVKIDLAREIVKLYHWEEKSLEAHVYFEKVLKEWLVPDEKDIEKIELEIEWTEIQIVTLLVKSGLCNSSTEARNALLGNSVKVKNELQTDPKLMIEMLPQNFILLQVGKKKFKMVTKK